MTYRRKFPRDTMSGVQRWEEIFLTAQEERECEQIARQDNLYLLRQCLADARNVIEDEKMMDMQSHVLNIALSLFGKRSQNTTEYKDVLCAEKFDKYWGRPKKKKKKEGAKSSSSSSDGVGGAR